MRYKLERKPEKRDVINSMFLIEMRCCEKCELAFWFEKVPVRFVHNNYRPICPDCGERIWPKRFTNLRIKKEMNKDLYQPQDKLTKPDEKCCE